MGSTPIAPPARSAGPTEPTPLAPPSLAPAEPEKISYADCPRGTWCRAGGGYDPGTVFGFSATAPDDLWAFGQSDRVHHWDGKEWKAHQLPGQFRLTVAAVRKDLAWALGDGILYRWDGARWEKQALDTHRAMALWANADELWLAGQEVWRLKGDKLEKMPSPDLYFVGLSGRSANDLWGEARGDDSQVIPVHWDGRAWKKVPVLERAANGRFHVEPSGAVWMAADRNLFRLQKNKWATVEGHGLSNVSMGTGALPIVFWETSLKLRTETGFQALPEYSGSSVYGVHSFSARDVWAAGSGFVAHFDGERWSGGVRPTSADFGSVSGVAGGSVWATAAYGVVWRYDGSAWQAMPELPEKVNGNYSVVNAGQHGVWVPGSVPYRWTGSGWARQPAPPGRVHALSFDGAELYLHGDAVHRWKGGSWEQVIASRAGWFFSQLDGDGKGALWVLSRGPRPEHGDGRPTGLPDEILEVREGKVKTLPPLGRPGGLAVIRGALYALGENGPQRWTGSQWEAPAPGQNFVDHATRFFESPAGLVQIRGRGVFVDRGSGYVLEIPISEQSLSDFWTDGTTLFAVGRGGTLMHATLKK